MGTGLSFVAALGCAAAMGLAIQRGGTCAVAAVDELMETRRAGRLLALFEAALWVGGGLAILQALDRLPSMPAGYPASVATVAGATLLGLGAWVNRACVVGSVARFGSGEWAYAAMPLGFFVGSASAGFVRPWPAPMADAGVSPVLAAASASAFAVATFAVLRALGWVVRGRAGRATLAGAAGAPATRRHALVARAANIWSPHVATLVIGLAFLALLVLAGPWAWTDAVAALARGETAGLALRLSLFAALLAGAALGGLTAGLFAHRRPARHDLARCFAGGALMGWGGAIVPGGNDGLVLVGMPLLWPYAWLAFATMLVVIAGAWTVSSRLRRRRRH